MRVFLLILILFFSFSEVSDAQYKADHYGDLFASLTENGLSQQEISNLLSSPEIEIYPNIMDRFYSANQSDRDSDYNIYDKFKTDESVETGRKFIKDNFLFLQKTEDAFGVPKEVITALLRVETNFGEYTGSYQAFGVFVSIMRYANDQNRVEWAKDELNALILLSDSNNLDPFSIRSSYAGAFGLPQFMPTSFVEFAEDGNGDGYVDLFNVEDAIWNIAKYLDEHGWHTNKRKAVYDYNHSTNFVDFVLWYAYTGLGTIDAVTLEEFKEMSEYKK